MRVFNRYYLIAALLLLCFVNEAKGDCGLCGQNHCICIEKVDCPQGVSGICGNIYRCDRKGADANCGDKNVSLGSSNGGISSGSTGSISAGMSIQGEQPSMQQSSENGLESSVLEAPSSTVSPLGDADDSLSNDAQIDAILGLIS